VRTRRRFWDFLNRKDIVQAAGVTIQDINALIANYLWEGLFGEQAARGRYSE
jgi:hypothetical protein